MNQEDTMRMFEKLGFMATTLIRPFGCRDLFAILPRGLTHAAAPFLLPRIKMPFLLIVSPAMVTDIPDLLPGRQ